MPDDATDTASTDTSSGTEQVSQQPDVNANQSAEPTQAANSQENTVALQEQRSDEGVQTENQASQWDNPANPYVKRFQDIQSASSRIFNQLREYQALGVDPSAIKQMLDAQKQREAVGNLKPYQAGHPEYNRFKQLRETSRELHRALQQAGTDETKRAFVEQLYSSRFKPEDIKLMEEAEQVRTEQLEQLQADPAGFISQHVEGLIAQKFQQYEQFTQTRQATSQWFESNGQLVDKYRDDMLRMMDPNVPSRDKAIEYAKMKAELEQLRATQGSAAEVNVQDATRKALLQSGTRQVQQPTASRQFKGDPVSYLTKKGFVPGTSEFAIQLSKLNNRR